MDVGSRFASNGIAISIRKASLVTSGVMLVGFVLSVLSAVAFNFKASTKTHCGVDNYLPSISAAIAEAPSSYIWRISVTLCSAQRLAVVFAHHSLYRSISINLSQYTLLCNLTLFFELVENLALIGLTCVSSVEDHKAHEYFFIAFQASAMVFMVLMCMLHRLAVTQGVKPSHEEYKSLMRLVSFLLINFISFGSAMYFFYRHNRYCESGVYTIFAFLEYVVVVSNICFHFTVSNNFGDREMRIGCRGNKF